MGADARVETYAVDDCLCVKTLHLGVCVELVEVAHAQRQISVGEELHRLSLLHTHEERVDVLLQSAFLQQCSEGLCCLLHALHVGDGTDCFVLLCVALAINQLRVAHDDAARVEIVVESLTLAQELGREEQVELLYALLSVFKVEAACIAHGDGALDDHNSVGVHLKHEVDNLLYVRRVEVVLHGVVVGRSGYHHEVGILIRCLAVESGYKVQRFLCQILLYIFVLYRRYAVVQLLYLLGYYVYGCHMVVLRKECCYTQSDIACAGYSNLYVLKIFHRYIL